jgi:hypothetical protein
MWDAADRLRGKVPGLYRVRKFLPMLLCSVLCLSAANSAFGQNSSSITGTVSDSTGAMIPGASVVITGSEIIGAPRTTKTDSNGLYKVVDLRPGAYTVTFTAPGFRTLKREGVDLPATFTATINGSLLPGEAQQEVTVTLAAPLVDVQDAQTETVIDRERMDTMPTGHDIFAIGQLIPGVTTSTPDVGGSTGMQQATLQVHGSSSNDNVFLVDGMWIQHTGFSGNQTGAYFNDNLMQNIVYTTDTLPAEAPIGGIQINMIPKEGGNQYHGALFATGATSAFQSNNLTPYLKSLGMTIQNRTDTIYDLDAGAGGPVLKDRLWFYGSFRRWGANNFLGNTYTTTGAQGKDDNRLTDIALRLTGKLSKSQKVTVSYDRGFKFRGHRPNNYIGVSVSGPEADVVQKSWMNYIAQAKYTYTPTSKLIFEAGATQMPVEYNLGPEPGVAAGTIALYDVGLSTMTRSSPRFDNDRGTMRSYMGAATYYTGRHTVKVGTQARTGWFSEAFTVPGDIIQVYNFGAPYQVYLLNAPLTHRENLNVDLGIYAEDTWKISRRITLNPGIRFEHMDMFIPAQSSSGGIWQAPGYAGINQPAVNVVDWNTFSPRFGITWDVFGNSKTALRGGVSKYDRLEGTTLAQNVNTNYIARSTCPWSSPILPTSYADLQAGLVAEGNKTCTGFPNVTARIDPNIKRPYQMEYTVQLQHEIGQRTAMSVAYYHRSFYDLYGVTNSSVPSTDYVAKVITNPITQQPLTVYNQVVNSTFETTLPQITQTYNGGEFTVNTRFSKGSLFGSFTVGKDYGIPDGSATSSDFNNPNTLVNLKGNLGYDAPFQMRAGGNYRLPGKIQVSGTMRENSGLPQQRTYSLPTGTLNQSQSVIVAAPGTYRYQWQSLIDIRVSRSFRYKDRISFEPVADLFNVFNSSAITSQTTTVNSTNTAVHTPSAINPGRLARFGGKITF